MAQRRQKQSYHEAPPQLRLTPAPMGPQPQVVHSVTLDKRRPKSASKTEKLAEIGAWVGSWFKQEEQPKICKADIGQPTGFMHVSGNIQFMYYIYSHSTNSFMNSRSEGV